MSAPALTIESNSPATTERLGRLVADLLPDGGVVALYGELASGKTCFVRGIASRFVDPSLVHSPTFTLINEYGQGPKLYHMDFYRLAGPEEVADLGCLDLFESGQLCAIEWADRAIPLLPSRRLDIRFEHAGEDQRKIHLVNLELLPQHWTAVLLDARLRD